MRPSSISGLVITAALAVSGMGAVHANVPGADIQNALAQKLSASMVLQKQNGAWSILRDQNSQPVDHSLDGQKQTGRKSSDMFLTTPSVGAQNHALLLVSCIKRMISISILYEGDGKIVSHLNQLTVSFDGSPAFDIVAMPMVRPDAIGINYMRAFRMIQQMRGHDQMTITRSNDGTSWTFQVTGLSGAIDQSFEQCNLGNQVEIGQNELTLFQMQLKAKGYPVRASGVMDDGMRRFIENYQKNVGLPQSGWLDRVTYDRLLSDIGD